MSVDTETAGETGPRATGRGTRIRNRGLTVVAAAVAAALVWVIAIPILGVSVTVPKSYGSKDLVDLGIGPVVVAAIFAGLLGWAGIAILEKISRRYGKLIWTVIAGVVFLITLPWMPDLTAGTLTVLALLHIAVAGVIIAGMRLTSPSPKG